MGVVDISGQTGLREFLKRPRAPIYGVEIDLENSNPETAVTYTDDAVGFTPMSGNDGNFSWGSWESVFNEMAIKPCLLKNGVVQYYLNPDNFSQKEDGSAADITSGEDGDVMIEFPRIYWKIETVGDKLTVQYSRQEFDGSVCHAHTVGTTIKDKIYISAFLGSEISSKMRSLSGKAVTASKTIGAFRTTAQANGSGYQQMCYYPLVMLQVLYLVWFKNRDSQTALGRGYVDNNAIAITTGDTISKGMFYGKTTGKQQIKFCGIEDFWGNRFYFIDGFFCDANYNLFISNQTIFNNTGSGYINRGIGAAANISGYIKTVQGGNETAFVIKEGGGSATTHFSDNGYLGASLLPNFGGYWADGNLAGAFQISVSGGASLAGGSLGARLTYIGTP